jgi:hypothetical protein
MAIPRCLHRQTARFSTSRALKCTAERDVDNSQNVVGSINVSGGYQHDFLLHPRESCRNLMGVHPQLRVEFKQGLRRSIERPCADYRRLILLLF